MTFLLVLFALTILVAIYDQRQRCIPPWVTWPLWGAGLIAHFPGTLEIILASIILIGAGPLMNGKIGFGDIKFWLALLWALPPVFSPLSSILLFAALFISAAAQLILTRLGGASSRPGPAAWRTLVYVGLLLVASAMGIHYA